MGRLIGKRGITADAIREVISIAGKNNNEHIQFKITSKDDNKVEEVEETNEEDC